MNSYSITNRIKSLFCKLFVTEIVNNNLIFKPENDNGHIEYKRTLINCNEKKTQQYATQMRWRITENIKHQKALYYIGVDDDGSVIGLSDDEIIDSISQVVLIASKINASITGIQIIRVKDLTIIRIGVKIKKIYDNYLVEFSDNF